jgi:hypothetical protein
MTTIERLPNSPFARALILARRGDIDGALAELPSIFENNSNPNPLVSNRPAFAAAAIIRALPEFHGYRIGEILAILRTDPHRTVDRMVALTEILGVDTPTAAIELGMSALADFSDDVERVRSYLRLAEPLNLPRRDLLIERAILAASAQARDSAARDNAFAVVAEWLITHGGYLSRAFDVVRQISNRRRKAALLCRIAAAMREQHYLPDVVLSIVNEARDLGRASGDSDLVLLLAEILHLDVDMAIADALEAEQLARPISAQY